jgi:hypothetical protein
MLKPILKAGIYLAVLSMILSSAARADSATCEIIRHAGHITRSLKIEMSGYNFAQDTPDIFGSGTETCTRLRDEAVNGKPATLYSQDFVAPRGTTHATIWISGADGTVVREELDADVKGKGKGHESMFSK